MADDLYVSFMKAHLEMEELERTTHETWRLECNAQGLEIYYDMTDAVERGVGCGPDCDEDCDETHTVRVGQYKTRPCSKHFKGHQCNPPRYAKITGLSTTGLTL